MNIKIKTIIISIFMFVVLFTTTSCKKIKLSDPENVRYDGYTITWNAVENAEKYIIQIDNGNEYEVTSNSYPYQTDNLTFSVKISAESSVKRVVNSGVTSTSFNKLDKIPEVLIDETGKLSWSVINNATAYEVRIDGEQTRMVTGTSFDSVPQGKHSIQVRPIVQGNTNYWAKWSDAVELTILSTVNSDTIKYEEGLIIWDAIAGTKSYEVIINGDSKTLECTTNYFRYDPNNSDFNVQIKALGNGINTFNAQNSNKKQFVFLDTIKQIRVVDGVLEWDSIPNATGYKIKLNGVLQSETLETNNYSQIASGNSYSVEVLPIMDDVTYFSDWCAPMNVTLLAIPEVYWDDKVDHSSVTEPMKSIVWNAVPQASGYVVKITYPNGSVSEIHLSNDEFSGEESVGFSETYAEIGTYKVAVKTSSDPSKSNVYDSKYCQEFTIIRLPAPKLSSKDSIISNPNDLTTGFTVNFEKVADASGYTLYFENNKKAETKTNQFIVTDIVGSEDIMEHNYTYTIQSLGSISSDKHTIKLDSLKERSTSFDITILSAPKDLKMSGKILSFSEVAKASSYNISSSGNENKNSGVPSYDLSYLYEGSYNVKVCAVGNGSNILASNYSYPVNIVRLSAPTNLYVTNEEVAGGAFKFTGAAEALSYKVVFDNNGEEFQVTDQFNFVDHVKETNTTVYMISVADCYGKDYLDSKFEVKTDTYYMTSLPSRTYTFIKLSAPSFGDLTFNNSQLIWNAPTNINLNDFTPTYEVYNADNNFKYNGEISGTTMDITYLEAGTYSFYVRAIGNGNTIITSESSLVQTITKLESPKVSVVDGKYQFQAVTGATSYAIYIDGQLMETFAHETGKIYYHNPRFESIKTYEVKVIAVGDDGKTTINSNPIVINQKTDQLTLPDFTVSYSEEAYSPTGEIIVTITNEPKFNNGYAYIIGGSTNKVKETEFRYNPKSMGTFAVKVYAVGGGYDPETEIYYLDSKTAYSSNNSSIIILQYPNATDIKMGQDGLLTWGKVNNAIKYELEIIINDGEIQKVEVIQTKYQFENIPIGNIKVKIRAIGNGTNIITSEWTIKEWDNLL